MKLCRSCHSPLVNKRSHALTCSNKCRMSAWRKSRITMLPVSFMLNIANYTLIKNAANAAGVSIDQFAHDHLVQTMEGSQC
ncbi:hypothetical protein D3C84_253270 [compost metagenome]